LIHSQNKLFIGKYKTSIDLAWQQNRRKLHTDQTKPVFTTVDMLLKTLNYSTKTTFPINNLTISTGIQGFWQNNKNFDAPDHVIPDATINEVSFYALLKYQKNKLNIENGLRYSHHTVDVPLQSNQNPGNPSFPLNKKFDNFSFSSGVT
jgi:iron complex outermembrane receptor protein